MGNMKDALLKAGLKPSKFENQRRWRPKKDQKKREIHQKQRNFCELCQTIQPDVEMYKHNNASINGNWICIRCADRNFIPDKTRVTNQSDFSKRGMFRREFI